MNRWLTGILISLAGVTSAPAHELLDRLDGCIAILDHELDVGYERVAARCPELTAELVHSAWSPWLPTDWDQPHNQLSAQGLTELRTLLIRSLSPGTQVHAPDPLKAAAVVARVSQPDPPRVGWWRRFKAWVRDLTDGRDGDSDPLHGWLSVLPFSPSLTQLLAGVLLALVVGIALAILLNELRIAGVLKPRGHAPHSKPPAAGSHSDRWLTELERRDPHEQPALLLELIAERLTAQGRLPPARALTARELLRGAELADDSERTWLSELAVACERLRFSTADVAAASIASAIAAGRRVLARLENGVPAPVSSAPRA